ncbi:MAG: 4-hydroxythreonine-4-phosphate dehydrogenase PdxA [Pseudomonadota bacterium]
MLNTVFDAPIPRLVVSSGEPAGIGPDLCVELLRNPPRHCELVVVADPSIIERRASALGHEGLDITRFNPALARCANRTLILPVQAANKNARPGILDHRNSGYVLSCLDKALELCRNDERTALVTGPIQKSVINDAGIAFTGHTEYLAEKCGVALPVMMLVSGQLRVSLATTHLPLSAVPEALNTALVEEVISITDQGLRARFGLANPRLAVCGLNPHAGESGHLGREDVDIIAPAIQRQRDAGLNVVGPLAADTVFSPQIRTRYDAVVAMFHDQGLAPLKALGFGETVNVTLGLPIVRTSVDHGTALELAATGDAKSGSMRAALATAQAMLNSGAP